MPEFVKKDHDYSAVESYLQNNDVNITNDLTVGGNITGNIPLRDYIINGSFKYWLDNTGLSAGAGSYRYTSTLVQTISSGNTLAVTRNSTNAGQTLVPTSSPYYATFTTTDSSGASDFSIIKIYNENVLNYASKTQTLSIWASASSGTPSIAVEGSQFFGAGGSPSENIFSISPSKITLSTSITRYDIVITWPSIAGKTLGTDANTSYSHFYIWFSAGSDYNARTNSLGHQASTVNIYKIQLIDGDTYQYIPERSDTEEINLIGRYYKSFTATGNNAVGRFCAIAATSTQLAVSHPFLPPMRVTPAVTISNNGVTGWVRTTSTGANFSIGSYVVNAFPESLAFIYTTSTSPFTAGASYDFDLTFDSRF